MQINKIFELICPEFIDIFGRIVIFKCIKIFLLQIIISSYQMQWIMMSFDYNDKFFISKDIQVEFILNFFKPQAAQVLLIC